MATQSLLPASKAKRTELDSILTVWEARYKLRVLSKLLPRALMVGLGISILIGLIGYSQRLLLAQNLALITLAICGIAGLVVIVYTQFFPRQRQAAAQFFDIEFNLQERVSTSFELLDGRIQTHPDIEAMQIADTLRYAHEIDPQSDIEMDFRQREWMVLAVLGLVMMAMIIVPLIVGQSLPLETPSDAVLAAQEDVREITETIAIDTDINEVDRDELLNALEIALERLEEEDITDEEAFAAMSQLESKIDEVQQELQDMLDLDQSALEAASESLSDFVLPPDFDDSNPTEEGETPSENILPSSEELSQALDQLGENAQNMSQEEAQAMADALREAAQELLESNPELAQALQDAADALENGDSESLQEQLEQAQQQLQQQQQQNQENQDLQQTLEDQSDRAQQSAEEISQEQSEQSQETQESNSSQESQQSQQAQESQEQSDSSQEGDNNGSQEGESDTETSQQGDVQGNQQSSSSQPSDSESQAQSQNSETAGADAGDGDPSNISVSTGGSADQGADTGNETTGDKEIEYQAIYNPTGIDGGGANEIELQTDASDQPFSEGDFDDNPFGESQVSYDTVFNDYQDAANRALESDYVPLGLRDVVRDYFTSLEPTGGN
jgi:hypothetical protein